MENENSSYVGKMVDTVIDRPLRSTHPQTDTFSGTAVQIHCSAL